MPALLHDQLWWVFAFTSSCLTATIYLMGQYVAMPALQKTFWRGLVPLIFLTPVLPFIHWPSAPLFYIVTLITALIVSYSDTKNFEAAARFGAGITIRMKPFIIWLVFALWFILHKDVRDNLLDAPSLFIGITLCLLAGTVSAVYLQKCPISRKALHFYMPLIFLGACVDILNKTAMDHSALLSGIILYAWIQALIITVVTGAAHKPPLKENHTHRFTHIKRSFKYGCIIGFLFLLANLTKNAAMSYTVNPSYVTAIIFTSPVWVSAYYRYIQHKETANIYAGYGLVFSAVALVLLTAQQ